MQIWKSGLGTRLLSHVVQRWAKDGHETQLKQMQLTLHENMTQLLFSPLTNPCNDHCHEDGTGGTIFDFGLFFGGNFGDAGFLKSGLGRAGGDASFMFGLRNGGAGFSCTHLKGPHLASQPGGPLSEWFTPKEQDGPPTRSPDGASTTTFGGKPKTVLPATAWPMDPGGCAPASCSICGAPCG